MSTVSIHVYAEVAGRVPKERTDGIVGFCLQEPPLGSARDSHCCTPSMLILRQFFLLNIEDLLDPLRLHLAHHLVVLQGGLPAACRTVLVAPRTASWWPAVKYLKNNPRRATAP